MNQSREIIANGDNCGRLALEETGNSRIHRSFSTTGRKYRCTADTALPTHVSIKKKKQTSFTFVKGQIHL